MPGLLPLGRSLLLGFTRGHDFFDVTFRGFTTLGGSLLSKVHGIFFGLFSKYNVIYNPGLISQTKVHIHLMCIIPNIALQQW